MELQEAYIVVASLILASSSRPTEAAVMQAEVDVGGDNNELLQMIFKQIEMLGSPQHNKPTSTSQEHTELVSALLQVAPVFTLKGNITDPSRRLTITFSVQASHNMDLLDSTDADDDDDKDDWDGDWRGSGGVFHPIVGMVEPYVLSLAELVFNGILSSVISNFLEGTSQLGDIRLV